MSTRNIIIALLSPFYVGLVYYFFVNILGIDGFVFSIFFVFVAIFCVIAFCVYMDSKYY